MNILKNNLVYIIELHQSLVDFCMSKISLLSTKERSKFDSFLQYDDKCRFIVGHITIRFLLNKNIKHEVENIEFYYNKYGKMFIIGDKLQFNISHSNNIVAIVISDDECGVDVEYCKDIEYEELSALYFANTEKCNNKQDFYRIWTIKEAYLKMQGKGLINDLQGINTNEICKTCNVNILHVVSYACCAIFKNLKSVLHFNIYDYETFKVYT